MMPAFQPIKHKSKFGPGFYTEIVTCVKDSTELTLVLSYHLRNKFGFGFVIKEPRGQPELQLSYEDLMQFGFLPQWDLSLYSEIQNSGHQFDDITEIYDWIDFWGITFTEAKPYLTSKVIEQVWNRYLCQKVVEL